MPRRAAPSIGLTRATGPADFARAALESVGYQTRDLLVAMQARLARGGAATVLRVDGGMVASDWTMQFLADILGAPVDRPVVRETTALGAAYLAGLQAGLCPAPEEFAKALAARPPLHPGDAGGRARRGLCRLAAGGAADAVRRGLGKEKGRALADPPPFGEAARSLLHRLLQVLVELRPGRPGWSGRAGPC